jgi:hypothetical protein
MIKTYREFEIANKNIELLKKVLDILINNEDNFCKLILQALTIRINEFEEIQKSFGSSDIPVNNIEKRILKLKKIKSAIEIINLESIMNGEE